MKKTRKFNVLGSGLNKQQHSTLDLWQQHMAALARASERRDDEPNSIPLFTEQSIATIVDRPSTYR
ncbi:hypothetical protein [Arenicella xantha]|uniref:Uncharacterized protein n=1 Tax=Arenicella xantha TaxID=644221 RepID=A0A395JIG3_9GAMM|nr:hypothetical protein [Arenicella xantha]RBP49379.1 hypothetical protein DFR28_104310 [Arenicella xantha]